jgi:hypothetical protein
MAGNANQIVVAGTGVVWIAPYTTALPPETAVFDTLDAAYVDMGFTTDDGVTLRDGITVEEINAWQSLYPVRRVVSTYTGAILFDLLQWSKDIFEQVLGGVTTEPVSDTVHKFVPTRDGVVLEKTIIVDFEDGTEDYRWVFPKVALGADIEIPIDKKVAATIPTEWGVLGGDAAGSWYMLTTDQNFTID